VPGGERDRSNRASVGFFASLAGYYQFLQRSILIYSGKFRDLHRRCYPVNTWVGARSSAEKAVKTRRDVLFEHFACSGRQIIVRQSTDGTVRQHTTGSCITRLSSRTEADSSRDRRSAEADRRQKRHPVPAEIDARHPQKAPYFSGGAGSNCGCSAETLGGGEEGGFGEVAPGPAEPPARAEPHRTRCELNGRTSRRPFSTVHQRANLAAERAMAFAASSSRFFGCPLV
jgi:hypothetical protein